MSGGSEQVWFMKQQHAAAILANTTLENPMMHKLTSSLLAGAVALGASFAVQAQSAGTGGTSSTDSRAFSAGRHADGSTGVRKAQSRTTAQTGGQSSGAGDTGRAGSSSTVGSGGSATAGSGVSASTLGTGGSSAGTQGTRGSTATSSTGSGASASASGPSGASASGPAGSNADPAPGASGYAHKHQPPGQAMYKKNRNHRANQD